MRLPVHSDPKREWTMTKKIDAKVLNELMAGCERPEGP